MNATKDYVRNFWGFLLEKIFISTLLEMELNFKKIGINPLLICDQGKAPQTTQKMNSFSNLYCLGWLGMVIWYEMMHS